MLYRQILHIVCLFRDVRNNLFPAIVKLQSRYLLGMRPLLRNLTSLTSTVFSIVIKCFDLSRFVVIFLDSPGYYKNVLWTFKRYQKWYTHLCVAKLLSPQRYNKTRTTVLHTHNIFLEMVEKKCKRYGLRVAYRTDVSKGPPKKFCNKTGIAGMLLTRDFDSLGIVSPSWRAIIDELFEKWAEAAETLTLTLYRKLSFST